MMAAIIFEEEQGGFPTLSMTISIFSATSCGHVQAISGLLQDRSTVRPFLRELGTKSEARRTRGIREAIKLRDSLAFRPRDRTCN